jgi:hypothetical protein
MDRTLAMLAGAGLGVGLMYLLDPQNGAKRRTMIRDRTVSTIHKTGDAVGRAGRDLGHQTREIAHRAMSNFRRNAHRPVDRNIPLDPGVPRI